MYLALWHSTTFSATGNRFKSVGSEAMVAVERVADVPTIEERLKKFNLDPTFVVEPEHRPELRPNSEKERDNIPVIDLSPLWSTLQKSAGDAGFSAAAAKDPAFRDLVAEVGRACEEWGFFQVVNHSVPLSLLDELQEVAGRFFSLPLAEKRKVRRTLELPLGYYDSELTKNKRDWKEVFDYSCSGSVEIPAGLEGDKVSEQIIAVENQWPANPPGLREACEKWSRAVESLASDLVGVISLSLGLPFSQFHRFFDKDTSAIRLNYYPKCPVPDLALGVSRHKDAGALTVLVQDEVGGLQVRRSDGEWISVQPRRDAFVINVGDLFQVWSNDRYRSVEHRVVVNENRDRFSFPLFFNPSVRTEVSPVPELLDAEHPPKYRTFNWGFFLTSRNNGNYEQLGEDIQIHHFAVDATQKPE